MSLCIYLKIGILRYEGHQGTEAVPELCTHPRLRDRNDQHVSGSHMFKRFYVLQISKEHFEKENRAAIVSFVSYS